MIAKDPATGSYKIYVPFPSYAPNDNTVVIKKQSESRRGTIVLERFLTINVSIFADDLKHVHQALLQSAKRAGSVDNITVIVVFLTSPVEIASQHSLLTHPAPNGLLLNNMDPNNPVSSNSGQFDVNATFIKQQQQQQQHQVMDPDLNHVICGMTRNGKHQDSDGNDDYYDYGDLGPETDVDGGEDANDVNRFQDHLVTSSSREKSPMEIGVDDEDDSKKEDLLNRDNANVSPMDLVVSDNRVILSDRDVRCDEKPRGNNDDDDNDNEESHVESTTGTHTLVDDDESPPSPRDASKCTLSVVKTRLCAELVYGYAYRAVSNLFVSLANYISASFASHVFGLRRK